MRRAWIVAGTEFANYVRSRSFVMALAMPAVMGACAGGVVLLAPRDQAPDVPARPELQVAVVDHTRVLHGALERAAARRNEALDSGGFEYFRFVLEPLDAAPTDGSAGGALIEIPAEAVASGEALEIRVVAPRNAQFALARFAEEAVAAALRARAVDGAGLSGAVRAELERTVTAVAEDMASPEPPEDPRELAELVGRAAARDLGDRAGLLYGLPFALALFFIVTMAAAPLLQGVLEEKTSRVSEILLSSISAQELVVGKLVGGLAANSVAGLVYGGVLVAGGAFALGAVPPVAFLLAFAAYAALGALLLGSAYLMVGAACADLKDTQNLMLPLILLTSLPIFFIAALVASPTGELARVLSLLPPTAGFAMLIRLSVEPGPGALDVALSLALLAAAAFAAVVAAGRVARIGLLLQGRSAPLREIARWAWRG